eukprot:gnl/TRDRNA2_/TRDRNA2_187983_c0_seq1.p1 gnl/TRDRNA2_/TRDRNA2_187983_c0~~gnl/TRDRNA2_/TRDRNA2_187983_c0_seq1.p1  ORF type:complete len:299 (-),score=53.31 gnl/TRDRNA2_/TRDRNA2_187983_c0_seq1:90-986(-)
MRRPSALDAAPSSRTAAASSDSDVCDEDRSRSRRTSTRCKVLFACMGILCLIAVVLFLADGSTVSIGAGFGATPLKPWPHDAKEVEAIIEQVYDGLDGSSISSEDVEKANATGTFMKTYGEFTEEGVAVLLKELSVSHDDVFCDLGSGAGKVVMQALLSAKPAQAFGIELSEFRHNVADQARERLWRTIESYPGAPVLRYLHGDILELDSEVSRCNKIFFCSTVWPQEMLRRMEQKLLSLQFSRRPVIVASSRELKGFGDMFTREKTPGAVFMRHARVDTSWGASFISLYMLRGSSTS